MGLLLGRSKFQTLVLDLGCYTLVLHLFLVPFIHFTFFPAEVLEYRVFVLDSSKYCYGSNLS